VKWGIRPYTNPDFSMLIPTFPLIRAAIREANQSINQKHTISNEYNELFADMQALVSSRRMLLIFRLALFVSSLRCLTGGAMGGASLIDLCAPVLSN
jgi:hypothetical protein